jgi:two-component system alkaline phosphatase synthesis response regulator PhoP
MKKTILIVDDEEDILEVLTYNLNKEGYKVETALTGKEVFKKNLSKIDLAILDVMIPEMNGFEICKALKSNPQTMHIPIIFLTAKDTEQDEINGLGIGAEDYIVKPIRISKLLARIRTVFRREIRHDLKQEIINVEELELDLNNYTVKIHKSEIPFTKKEFESLVYLIRNRGKIVNREMILNNIWGENIVVGARTIDVHIRKIREKLGKKSELIETIKGIGYRFKK